MKKLVAAKEPEHVNMVIRDLRYHSATLSAFELMAFWCEARTAAKAGAAWAVLVILIPRAHPNDSLARYPLHKRPLAVAFSAGVHP